MLYDMPLYRPPSEGDNLILQVTLGCSFNGCTFCSMYKAKTFRIRTLEDVFADIAAAAADWPEAHRVFLADGDALTLPTDHLFRILDHLRATFPDLARVSCYATPVNLLGKTSDELRGLRDRGLTLVYVGIESGSGRVLRHIRKGATPASMAAALERARGAGLKISATVVLGLGGRRYWEDHVDGTVAVVNRAAPHFLSTLQLYLEDTVVPRFLACWEGEYEPQDDIGILAEQERLLSGLEPATPVIFRSNHASNCLALAGTLPKDRGRLLAEVRAARQGASALRPRFLRRL
ncbi:MAG: radical SAM protein [Magnetospirillum sp. WYHS-4]